MINVSVLYSTRVSAASAITVSQTPYIINDSGTNKSETKLTINNSDPAYSAWVKITVAGHPSYLESIGTLNIGLNKVTVHVVELNNDGDNVTFEVYDNADGTGTARANTTIERLCLVHKAHFTH